MADEMTNVNKGEGERDPNLVYPSTPPKSPHFCWLNIIAGGIAQIIFGQVAKGVTLFVATILLLFVEMWWVVNIISIIDAYMVGKVLQSGRPVGQWKFFPT
jgi:hypothetical protein